MLVDQTKNGHRNKSEQILIRLKIHAKFRKNRIANQRRLRK